MTGYNYNSNPNNPLQRDRRRAKKEADKRECDAINMQVKRLESQIEIIDNELIKINGILNDPNHHSRPDLLMNRRRKKKLNCDKKELIIKRDQIKPS